MPHNTDNLINDPDAARVIVSLRDMGYDLYTAAADIIDNSIAAKATEVNIKMSLMEDGRKFVCFGDNGIGMTPDGLRDAMRYGAPKRESAKSLGKFGLGLKTASSSCCKRFTVITRSNRSDPLSKLAWDLEHVEAENKWEMVKETVSNDEIDIFNDLCGPTGTLVIWAKCDRILGKIYEEAGGTREQNAMKKRIANLSDHISLVFHKYLDSSYKEYGNVKITLNALPINPWNPFYPERSEQVLSPDETVLKIESEDGTISKAILRAWILPHAKDMTKEENKAKARISNRAQGFYIYREGRLIDSGGWMGVFNRSDDHWSLLRAEFCFDHDLDHAFDVDVLKSRILFDPGLEKELKNRLTNARNEANARYRRRVVDIINQIEIDHKISNTSIENAKTRTKIPTILDADPTNGVGVITNKRGPNIQIKTPIQNNVSIDNLYLEPVEDIRDGNLWEPALRSVGDGRYVTGVRINKHHPFYQKIYKKVMSKYAVEGMDLLLWAISAAEYNNRDEELKIIFEDIREEISSNLKKLLHDVPFPDETDLSGESFSSDDE